MENPINKICDGCDRVRKDGTCMVYAVAPSVFIRRGACPFNYTPEVKKTFKRVGQQKQKTRGN